MMYFTLILAFAAVPARAELSLTPQLVVERILGEGRESKAIELEAQSAYTDYYENYRAYDLGFTGRVSREDSRIDNLSGSGNLRDRNTVWSAALEKRVPTGTTFQLRLNRTSQNSVFRSASTRSPYAVYDVGELTITQDLLGNFFGVAERRRNRAAEASLASSQLLKKEQQEDLVLASLRLFWTTYVAQETLREAVAQRDKYDALVKEVEKKGRLGFSMPGDLPKARAEFGAQVRNVKRATFDYLKNLDQLLTAMRMESDPEQVRFRLDEEIPALPTMVMPELEPLRVVVVNRTRFDSAELIRRATDVSARWPELKFIGTAGLTGLDADAGKSFSRMAGGERPRYLAALELSYNFFSSGRKATLNRSEVGVETAFNDLLQAKESLRHQIHSSMENVRYTYAAALSAIEESKQWEAAVRAQERSYQQGRQDFSQLIQDYNRYYQAQAMRIRAIGDYHIALHAYAASVDTLVN